jgi:hypothetical protein
MPNIILRTAVSALALSGAVYNLRADSVCLSAGSCNANWQPFVTPVHHTQVPGPDGPVYFDGFSYDAPDANIAYFIEGQGYFQGNPDSPDAPLPFWGNPDGSAVTSFFFQSGGQAQIANFEFFQGLWAPFSSIGWYDADDLSVYGWILQPNGTEPQPQSVEFTPTDNFGLFFVPDSVTYDPNQTPAYFTDSTRNGIAQADVDYAAMNGVTLGPEAFQHFAVFQQTDGGYTIGVNDRSSQVGDHDYNDMVFQLTAVPEPGSFSIACAFALGLCAVRHRWQRTTQG